jgi:hypothetical protein
MKFARAGDLRYRYELQVVRGGFTSLLDDQKNDTEILERICTAYIKAVQQDSISHPTGLRSGGRFALSDLGAPRTGDPFGVLLQGTLLRTGAEYQHYCAQKIRSLLPEDTATMVEIGGGFGGMAYYLLRDCAEVILLIQNKR